jgi:molybdenum-dependent DNA-binding transcriptional regulator ModE
MEHIVQFAIGIDDEGIKERITESAEKQIIKDIEQQVRNKLFESSYYGRNANENSPLNDYSKRLIESFLEKHKDEILEKAATHLAEKLVRTKAAKALLEKRE